MRRAASVALAALYASLASAQADVPATPAAAATFKDPMIEVITALKPAPLQAGECASYANGTANAVLCLQKATVTPADTVLLVGFLYNNGTTEICDLKLKSLNAPGLTALWPDWAADASYERYFNLKQVTAVGLTAATNADGSLPSVEVTSMRACTEDAAAPLNLLLSRKVDITDASVQPPTVDEEAATAAAAAAAVPAVTEPAGVVSMARAWWTSRHLANDQPSLFFSSPVAPEECAVYRNGTAHLSLCVESVTKPSGTIQVLKGFLYNNGTAAACDVRLRAVNAPGVVELWPEWGPSASYELFFNPKQVTSVGMTLKPNADGSLPSVEVYSFHTCGEEGRKTNLNVQKEPMTSLVLPAPEVQVPAVLNGGIAEKAQLANVEPHGDIAVAYKLPTEAAAEDKAIKAFKPGYDVTTDPAYQDGVEVPPLRDDYDICKRFEGADPSLEVTVCLENAKTWHDKKRGRIVSTDLALINTGFQGVCNVTVYIEGMEDELEHFPQLIDDNGFDTYPKFVSWYAPGRITNLGSAIPKTKGVPRFTVLNDFVACEEPDPNLVHRRFRCTESTRKPNAAVKVCVYSDLKEWSDADGARMVSVEGFLSNTGMQPLCNLTVDISNFENARAYWGDWMPTFPYYLDEGSTLKFAANIPYPKGYPKVSLKKYAICPHKVEAPKATVPKAESIAANQGPAAPAVPAAPAAPAGPAAPKAPAAPAVTPKAPAAPAAAAPAEEEEAAAVVDEDTPAVEKEEAAPAAPKRLRNA